MEERRYRLSVQEKNILEHLLAKYKTDIDNKKTDALTNIKKNEAWDQLCSEFNEFALVKKNKHQLQKWYRNTKMILKRNAKSYNQQIDEGSPPMHLWEFPQVYYKPDDGDHVMNYNPQHPGVPHPEIPNGENPGTSESSMPPEQPEYIPSMMGYPSQPKSKTKRKSSALYQKYCEIKIQKEILHIKEIELRIEALKHKIVYYKKDIRRNHPSAFSVLNRYFYRRMQQPSVNSL